MTGSRLDYIVSLGGEKSVPWRWSGEREAKKLGVTGPREFAQVSDPAMPLFVIAVTYHPTFSVALTAAAGARPCSTGRRYPTADLTKSAFVSICCLQLGRRDFRPTS